MESNQCQKHIAVLSIKFRGADTRRTGRLQSAWGGYIVRTRPLEHVVRGGYKAHGAVILCVRGRWKTGFTLFTLIHDPINGKPDIIIGYIHALVYNIRRVVMECLGLLERRLQACALACATNSYTCEYNYIVVVSATCGVNNLWWSINANIQINCVYKDF